MTTGNIHIFSGHDAIGNSSIKNDVILPYLNKYAENYQEIFSLIEETSVPDILYEFAEDLAYGSGYTKLQIDWLEDGLKSGRDAYDIIFTHHPIIYPKITIRNNIPGFLDLCRKYGIECVCSGHTHQIQDVDVIWSNGNSTIFETTGAIHDGHFTIIKVHTGNVIDGNEVIIQYV